MSASSPPRPTFHAAERWTQRVDRGLTIDDARRRLEAFAAGGHLRKRPKRWARGRVRTGSRMFLVHPDYPHVMGIVCSRKILTVFSRGWLASQEHPDWRRLETSQ